jgi:membrane-associated protease RseP (regulator of RpoE activity)
MTLTEKQAKADAPPLGPDASGAGASSSSEPTDAPSGGSLRRVVQLLVAVAAVSAIFIVAGQGDLLLFIAILIVIVMLHELGHFATAKRAGMKVTEYFVGFGPRLWSVRRGETEYGVKAIPAGGYVRITGFTSTEEVDEEDEARAYRSQPFHQRIIVASAGSAMHFLIAVVLALIVVLGYGQATNNYTVASLEHWHGQTTPAAAAGLRSGDTIVSIDGKTFATATSMTDIVQHSTGKTLNLGVERDGRLIHVQATPQSGKGITVNGQKLGNHGYLGVTISPATTSVGVLAAPGAAFSMIGNVTSQTASGVGHLFSPSGLSSIVHQVTNQKAAQSAAANPGSAPRACSIVCVAHLGTQTEQIGLVAVLTFLIAINIAFGIFNMLPMIPLDGGHVAIAAYEWIRTKKGRPYYRADITKLMPVATVFVAFLLLFVAASVYLDITHPLNLH